MISPIDRIHGCLLGIAVGDAMGMPALYSIERTIEIFGAEISGFIDASKNPEIDPVHYLLPAGMVTDDTYATLSIVKTIIRTNSLSVEEFAKGYVEWADLTDALMQKLGRQTGLVGPSTGKAINQIRAGISPWTTGYEGKTNGASMRVAPIGFLFPGDLQATVDAVEITCIPTHFTNIAISAASAVACAVSACADGKSSLNEIIDAAKEGSELGRNRGRAVYCPSIAKRIDLAVKLTKSGKGNREVRQDILDFIGTDMISYESVPAAIAAFVLGEGDPQRTVNHAINIGGDNDTLGAIAGGIAGAYYGIQAFPSEFSETIETVNRFNLAQLSLDYSAALLEVRKVHKG